MKHYQTPIENMHFVLFDVLDTRKLALTEKFADATEETFKAIMQEAAKFAENILLPINQIGDKEGCKYDASEQTVKTATGFKEAYALYQQSGWSGLTAPQALGGQGLPQLLKIVVDEMICSTNLSFGMYPGLSHGVIDTLSHHSGGALQAQYLNKLIEGSYTGTMCLTEPQCGTDLGLINTKAEPNGDESYRITGSKIWITGGEHDLSDNIIHLVLAKLPDAPNNSKGISLFLVPKILPDGKRNAVYCTGLEHKMGINASATCMMSFEGAKAWLVGKPNHGLKNMFTMMNAARVMVGMQGLGLAETAYQVSLGFSKERRQSRALNGASEPDKPADKIIVHPDVRRMLLKQKIMTEGSRAMIYWTCLHLDLSHALEDEKYRVKSDDIFQLMTPVVKSFLTDEGFHSIDQAIQTMGGAGFTKDWPLEQLLRDARISRIYEGTNGIQALDLVGRKLTMQDGRLVESYFSELDCMLSIINNKSHKALCQEFINTLKASLDWLKQAALDDPNHAGAAASPLLRMFALTTLAVLWANMAHAAEKESVIEKYHQDFIHSKAKSANHFYRLYLPEIKALKQEVTAGKDTIMAFSPNEF